MNSRSEHFDTELKVRLSTRDKTLLVRAARSHGISLSEFIRNTGTNAARQVAYQ